MGWAHGIASDGRHIGYGVRAMCDVKGCKVWIDRGLGYCCGSMHEGDNDDGCGGYFCSEHLPHAKHDCSWAKEHESDEDEEDDEDDSAFFVSGTNGRVVPVTREFAETLKGKGPGRRDEEPSA